MTQSSQLRNNSAEYSQARPTVQRKYAGFELSIVHVRKDGSSMTELALLGKALGPFVLPGCTVGQASWMAKHGAGVQSVRRIEPKK